MASAAPSDRAGDGDERAFDQEQRAERRASEKPVARSTPICGSRCSTLRRKNSADSSSADTIRKKLKYEKYAPKSVAPADAARFCARTSTTREAGGDRIDRRARSPRASRDRRRRSRRSPVARAGTQADRRELAVPRAPERLAGRERDERLRRRAVLVPVRLVLRANQPEIDRKRRIPIARDRWRS